jgi:hypothetical protein
MEESNVTLSLAEEIWCSLNRRLGRTHSQFARFGHRKKLCSLLETELRTTQPIAQEYATSGPSHNSSAK